MTVQHIADLEPARRTAILVAQAAEPGNPARRRDARHVREIHGHAVQPGAEPGRAAFPGHAARCRQGTAPVPPHHRRAPARAKETGEDGVAVVEREIGMKQLDGVLPVIGAVADVADQDILVTAAERYSVLRRFSPRFLAAFDFRSNTPNDPVLAAVELLRAMDRDGTRALPKRPPSSFLPPQMAQADLRERRGGPAALRNGGACHAARAAEGQQHLGRWQPRLSGVRGLPAARRSRARHRHRRRDRSRPLHRQPHGRVARAPDLRGRPRRRAANSTASRSRTANSTSPAPSRPSPRPRAIWPFG